MGFVRMQRSDEGAVPYNTKPGRHGEGAGVTEMDAVTEPEVVNVGETEGDTLPEVVIVED